MRLFHHKIRFCLVIAGMLIAILLLVTRSAPLVASTGQSTGSFLPGGLLPWPGISQQNNQLAPAEQEIKRQLFFGRNQDNDGNQGFNTGTTQDNSGNKGNLVTNQHRNIQYQLNHQVVQGGAASSSSSNSLFLGADQGNSGNTGVNLGNNIDSSGNKGNVVNNQGSVIGTQVNAPGTDVNNDGSTIQLQVVHRSWLPPVSLQLQPFPGTQFSLKVGG